MSTDVFAVIADPTRRRILQVLHSGPHAVNDVVAALGVSQPTVSKHLRVLREADLVSMRAEGQKRYYALHAQPLEAVARWIAELEQSPPGTAGQERAETAEKAEASQEPVDRKDPEVREDAEAPAEPTSSEPEIAESVPEARAEDLPEPAEEPSPVPQPDSPAETAEHRTVRRRRSGVVFHPLTPTRTAQEPAAPAEPALEEPQVSVPPAEAEIEAAAEPGPAPSPQAAPTPPASLDPHVRREPVDSREAAETKPGGILASLFGRKRGR